MDGNSVVHNLHSMDWSNGGQYPEYRREVRKFYSGLQKSGIIPIVVFDGVDNEEQKIDTVIRRRQEWVNYINKQITSDASRPIKCGGHVLPFLASEVYRMALHDLGIKFYVADGEADSVIARVANHHSCPVLSQDSDFFIFRLVEGYIPFDHFYWRSSVVTADVYYRERFATQLNFQDCNLFYAIPAIVGNDFLAPCSSTFIMSILDAVPNGGSIRNRIRPICIYLSQFCSLESYTTSTATGRELESRCRETVQMYDVPVGLSCKELVESTVLKHHNGSSLPHWLIRLFHQGHVPSAPIDAAVICKSIFRMNSDNFQKKSSIVAGQIVRQHMYALLQCEEIVEVFRHGLTISGVKVSSKRLPGEFHKVTVSCVDTLSPHQRERLFYTIMQCDEQACNKLMGKYQDWQFVAATVTLWAKTTAPPATLVKALLLCFMICSGLSDTKLDSVRRTCRVPVRFRQSHKWLNVIHSFAEWQVIHHTAWTLNALLMEPMSVFSPAFLYDGEIAMYLSSAEDISRLLFEFDIDMTLYACLEEIVLTGCTPTLSCPTPNTTSNVQGVEPVQPVEAVKVSMEVEEQTCSGFQQGALSHLKVAPCVNKEPAAFIVKEQKAAGRECISSQIQCTGVDSEAENEHKTKKRLAKEQAQIDELEKQINNSQSHGQQEACQPINKPRTVEPHAELMRSGGKELTNTTPRKSDPLNEKANTQKKRRSRHGASEKGLAQSGEKIQTGKEQHKTAQDINPSPVLQTNSTKKASTSQVLVNPPPIAIAGQSSRPVTSESGIQKQTSEQRRDSQTPKLVSGKEECSGLSRMGNPQKEAPTGETVTTDHAAVSSRDAVKQTHTQTHATGLLQGSREAASQKQVPELRGEESEPKKNTRKRRRRRQHRAQLPKEDIDMTRLEEIVLTGCTPTLCCPTPNTTTSAQGVEPVHPVKAVKVSMEVGEQTCSGFQEGVLNHVGTTPCVNKEPVDFIVKEQKAAGRECISSQIQYTRVDSEAENEHKTKKRLAKEQAQINEHEKQINSSQSHGQQKACQPINKPRTVEPHEELTRSGGKELTNTTPRKSDPLNEKANTQKKRRSRHGASEKGLAQSGEKIQTGKEQHKTAQDINPSLVLQTNSTKKASTSQVLVNPPPIAIAGTQSSRPVTSESGIQKQTSEQRRDSQTPKLVSGKEECSGLSRMGNPRKEAPTGETVTTDHAAVSSRDAVQQAHTQTHATGLLEGSREAASQKQVPELRDEESEPKKNTRKRRRRRQHRAQLPKEDIDMTRLEEIVLTGCTPTLCCPTPNTTTSAQGVEPVHPVKAVKVSVEVGEQTCSGFQEGVLNHVGTTPCVNKEPVDFIVKEQKAAGRECISSQIQYTRVDSEAENEHKTKKRLAKEQAHINEHEKQINSSQSHGQQKACQPINKSRTVEPHAELTRSGGKELTNTTSRKSDPLNEKASTQKRRRSRHGASEKGLAHSGGKIQTGKEQHKTAQDINPSPVLQTNSTRKASTSQVLMNPPPIAIAGTQSSRPVTSESGIQKQTSDQRRDSQTPKPVSGKEECHGLSRMGNSRKEAPTGKTVTTDHAAVSSRDAVQQAHTHTHATGLLQGSREAASQKQVPELRGEESKPKKNTRKRRQRRQHRAQLPKEDIDKPP